MLVKLTVDTCDAATGKRLVSGEVVDLPDGRAGVAIAKGLAVAVEDTPAEEPSEKPKRTTKRKTASKK